MTLQITVRGSAQDHFPAERAQVTLAVVVEGADREQVLADAAALQDPLTSQLHGLADRGAVATWSSEQVRVYSHRPWAGDHQTSEPVHTARLQVRAEFSDFESLSGFVDAWGARQGVEVEGLVWDVSAKNRRIYEAEVRKAAVDDAVDKAQAYADAVRRGRVTARQLADPGMLDGGPGEQAAVPLALRGAADGASPASLDLVPEEIEIRVEVDARFTAE